MKCSVCGIKVTTCDECSNRFKKGYIVFCNTDGFDKHECKDCYVEAPKELVTAQSIIDNKKEEPILV